MTIISQRTNTPKDHEKDAWAQEHTPRGQAQGDFTVTAQSAPTPSFVEVHPAKVSSLNDAMTRYTI